MSKSIKFRNDIYLDTTAITHNRTILKPIIDSLVLRRMTTGVISPNETKTIPIHMHIKENRVHMLAILARKYI